MLRPEIHAVVLDMDGVLWKDDAPLGDIAAAFRSLRQAGVPFAFATNNSTATPAQYVSKLGKYGVQVSEVQIVTSSIVIADLVRKRLPAGARVFAIGEDGLKVALRAAGLRLTDLEDFESASAVIMGMDRAITFETMRAAASSWAVASPSLPRIPTGLFPPRQVKSPGRAPGLPLSRRAQGFSPRSGASPLRIW